MPFRDVILRVACTVLAALPVACSSPHQGSPVGAPERGASDTRITVGSFDFPESVLLAHLYAAALTARGFQVRILPKLGNREVVEPALMSGLVQVVPEYSGSALDFLSLGRLPASADAAATYRSLARSAQRRGLVAAQPAPAQNANAIVVSAETAARHGLQSIADLAELAPQLVFGGPPECQKRSYCLPGLEATYGLSFKAFAPTDAGGPLTRQALVSGQIDVGLLFTTDPSIKAHDLVILADSRGLQPAENVTPLVHHDAVDRYGSRLVEALDNVSARLSTRTLRELNERVQLDGVSPHAVADDWLAAQGAARIGGGVP